MFDFDIDKILKILQYNEKDPLLFNSGFFLVFFFVFLLFYQFVYKRKLMRVVYFIIFSLYFFYKASGWYFLLIILAAVVDYNISQWIYKSPSEKRKKALLFFSIVINLGLLAWFKCTNFFLDIYGEITNNEIQPLHLLLPVGISFYTFENLSYTIDVYRGTFKPVSGFLDYCFFLSFFPKLMMGPIVRASDFIPQIRQDISVNWEQVGRGMFLILNGLFKKAVISDYLSANFVDTVFDMPGQHSGVECLFAVYGYAIIIYCDFSGYSDMAIGIASWMGFNIPPNFNKPYQATDITQFWRRWHISLSNWLRDYLYISLGGNRKGNVRTYVNLMVTMLLGGIWHMSGMLRAENWKFIFWGGMHGLGLAADKYMNRFSFITNFKQKAEAKRGLHRIILVLITFHFVCFCWIFFRASSFTDGITMLGQIFSHFTPEVFLPMLNAYTPVMVVLALGFVLHLMPIEIEGWWQAFVTKLPWIGKTILLVALIWLIVQVKSASPILPIYLQF
jgi:alginate O-acetyltransferase complex protein AlgI